MKTRILIAILAILLTGCQIAVSGNADMQTPIAPKTALYGNSNGNVANTAYILEVGDDIYIANQVAPSESALYRYNALDGSMEKLLEDCRGYLNLYNNRLYYLASDGIVSADLDGKDIKSVYEAAGHVGFIIYDDMLILNDQGICSIDLDSVQITDITDKRVYNINVGEDKIYCISLENVSPEVAESVERLDISDNVGAIYQMDLDGGNWELLCETIVTNLIYHEGYLYFLPLDAVGIQRLDVDTRKIDNISDTNYQNFNIINDRLVCSSASSIDILELDGALVRSITADEGFRDTAFNVTSRYVFYRRFASHKLCMLDVETGESCVIIQEDT